MFWQCTQHVVSMIVLKISFHQIINWYKPNYIGLVFKSKFIRIIHSIAQGIRAFLFFLWQLNRKWKSCHTPPYCNKARSQLREIDLFGRYIYIYIYIYKEGIILCITFCKVNAKIQADSRHSFICTMNVFFRCWWTVICGEVLNELLLLHCL